MVQPALPQLWAGQSARRADLAVAFAVAGLAQAHAVRQ